MDANKRMSLQEFIKHFGTEEQCRQYLFEQRWLDEFVCPKCGARKGYQLSDGTLQCATRRHQTSATVGTVLHRSHLSLSEWFKAPYFVSQDKRGISAVELHARLGVTYKTAWYILSRIREAMEQRDNQHKLSGTIEFDNVFSAVQRQARSAGAVQRRLKCSSRCCWTAKAIPDSSK